MADRMSDQWETARRQARAFDRYLTAATGTDADIELVAREIGLSVRRCYELIAKYRARRLVSDLIPARRKRKPRLPERTETIIARTLKEKWMRREAPPLAPIVEEIRLRCREAGLAPPSYNAVEARIPKLFTPLELAKTRGKTAAAVRRLRHHCRTISADRPLDRVQIDHTPADIMVADAEGRVIGRPTITLCTDVATKAKIGFAVSFEYPGLVPVADCLQHAISPKEGWLAERGLKLDWSMWGRPRAIHVDSGAEFKSKAFETACEDLGIKLSHRNAGTVQTGGLVERALGLVNEQHHAMPGRTGRSPAHRGAYASMGSAVIRLATLERNIAIYIAEVLNCTPDRRTGIAPIDAWNEQMSERADLPDDPEFIFRHFLPSATRRLSPSGIRAFNMHYTAPKMAALVAARDLTPKLTFKYDPRDLRQIYVQHPEDGDYFEAYPFDATISFEKPYPVWEHRQATAARDRQGLEIKRAQARRRIDRNIEKDEASAKARRNKERLKSVSSKPARKIVRPVTSVSSWSSDIAAPRGVERI